MFEDALNGVPFAAQVPGPHFEGEHGALFQNQTLESPVPAGPVSTRGALRLWEGGRLLLRPQPRRAQGLDDAERAR